MQSKYRTRFSTIILLVMILPVVMPAVLLPIPLEGIVAMGAIMAFCLLLLAICYRIEGDKLYVGHLFFKGTEYDLKKLKSISKTRTILSSPASSLKRIKLVFSNGDELVISPARQDEFLDEIRRINLDVIINL